VRAPRKNLRINTPSAHRPSFPAYGLAVETVWRPSAAEPKPIKTETIPALPVLLVSMRSQQTPVTVAMAIGMLPDAVELGIHCVGPTARTQ